MFTSFHYFSLNNPGDKILVTKGSHQGKIGIYIDGAWGINTIKLDDIDTPVLLHDYEIELMPTLTDMPYMHSKSCECGADAIGSYSHSVWCPKHD